MDLYSALRRTLTVAAENLALPLGWEGEAFVVPHTAHLRGRIEYAGSTAATLGSDPLVRLDGSAVITVVTSQASGDTIGQTLARQVKNQLELGKDIEGDEGYLTLLTPSIGTTQPDGKRLHLPVTIPFFGYTTKEPS